MTFDREQALECAGLIQELYQGKRTPTVESVPTDTQALVIRKALVSHLIFPGTASLRDGITDLRAGKVRFNEGKAHAGFCSAWNSVRDLVQEQLAGARLVLIGGHSLGGALATLAADTLATSHRIAGVYTFGSPRVGNVRFARNYDAVLKGRTWRVVNAKDPIPRVPWMLGTYRHVGTKVYLHENGEVEVNAPVWRGLLSSLAAAVQAESETGTVAAAGELVSLQAHAVDTYIWKLERAGAHGVTRPTTDAGRRARSDAPYHG